MAEQRRHQRLTPEFLLFTCSFVFMELVFKVATGGSLWPAVLAVVLFSAFLGQLLAFLVALVANRRAAGVIRVAVLLVVGVLFCVEYFVFREFKVFYDVKTVVGGAGGVATQFGGDALALILTPSGILCIVLFLVPGVAYAIHLISGRRRHRHMRKPAFSESLVSLATSVVAFVLAMVMVNVTGSWGQAYFSRYSFQQAVDNFGLLTAIRRDIQLGGSDVTFSVEETAPDETDESGESAAEEPVTYGQAVMDIDWDSLDRSNPTLAALDDYVQSLTPSSENEMTGRFEGYNLVFVSAEAFSAEAIREDTTPTLYRMATKGINFTDYYQPAGAGTTGGECQNLLGVLATEGGASVKDTATYNNYFTIGNALNRLGYNGWAFHNNTYTYYDRDLTHNNLGYDNGYMGYGNGMEAYVTWQWPQSDLEMVQGTFDDIYGLEEPFNVYYMSVSGHSTYTFDTNAMSRKNEDAVADLDYSEPVRGYLACNVELDKAMEYLIGRLEEEGIADHTVIVISADHFPYGLDDEGSLGNMPYLSELYGYNVETSWQRDHNRLIIWSESLEDEDPVVVDEPVSSIDVLPTLLNLFGCEWDSRLLPGRDVFSDADPLVFDLLYNWKTDLGTYYYGTFTANEGVTVPDGYVDAVNATVDNKMNYCRGVLENDYFAHLFGPAEDVQTVHDEGVAAHPEYQPSSEDAADDETV